MTRPRVHQPSGLPESNPTRADGLLADLHLDIPLLTGLFLLCGFGLVVLYSASDQHGGQIERQLFRLGAAFVGTLLVAQIPPAQLRRWSPWFYGFALLLLITVLIVGEIGKGAQRWLDIGVFRFQPSELTKLSVPMMIAWFLAEKPLPPQWKRLLAAGAMILLPVLLIARQPDLGTSLLVASAGIFVLFLAGLSWRFILGMMITAIPVGWITWEWGMHDYQRDRVLTFLDPESDPLGTGYHIIQSKIAIGSGGLYGKGWLNGTQSHLEFLPERTTDFIFAVLSEEFGLIGILLLLTLYLLIILRGMYIAVQAQDTYSRLLAGTVTLVFFFYLFINTGMVTGILPVVGVPLPLVSYGGTSLVTIMIGFGILMSIHTHRKLLPT
ncbi:MAG: rod shape-determining protein RodA [Gammaproteobacteria bacterium]|nr:rod shape-determining protein RodA [Gammaproteobacteria bacterium]